MAKSDQEMTQGMQGALDKTKPQYGLREDGTPKGNGWLGPLKHSSGGVASEISIGVGINGKETLIPSIVPTLDKGQVDYLLNTHPSKLHEQDPVMWNGIVNKATDHAKKRVSNKLSPFID
jgi:hypothetical protein